MCYNPNSILYKTPLSLPPSFPSPTLHPQMASKQNLSTPDCPAEIRAWLLIYRKRIGVGKPLVEAFIKQFPDREHYHILHHAACVRDSSPALQSQLLEFAKQFSWYEDAPRKGGKHYKRMKVLERHEAARERLKSRYAQVKENLIEAGVGTGDEGE